MKKTNKKKQDKGANLVGDQNVTSEDEAHVDYRRLQNLPPHPGQNKHLGATYFCMTHCQEHGCELPTGHLALNKEEKKTRALYTLHPNNYPT